MQEVFEDKRDYPRIKANLRVNIAEGVLARSADVSEGGARLNCEYAITTPTISLQIHFPNSTGQFRAEAKLIWKQNVQQGSSSYGVEFLHLSAAQRRVLREELIKAQIAGLLRQVEDLTVRAHVCQFFLNDTLDYIDKVLALIDSLSQRTSYALDIEEAIERLNNQILLKGYALELLLDNGALMGQVKRYFRQLVHTWIYKSVLLRRTFCKCGAYPLDCRMLEIIYDNQPVSAGIGIYFDKSFLKNPYAVAIRKCKDYLKTILADCIRDTYAPQMKMMAVSCSSCRELREMLPDLAVAGELSITCLDEDDDALRCSQDNLRYRIPRNTRFSFAREAVSDIIEKEGCLDKYGRQNIIYSMGVADYLSGEALKKFIAALYGQLAAGGKLIITHRNAEKTFAGILPDWFCDTKPFCRSHQEVTGIFHESGISNFSLATQTDNFSYIYYFIVTKNTTSYQN